MTLPVRLSTDRLTLPLWESRDIAAIRGEIARSPHWHPEFPRQDDADAATMWVDGDRWGPRSIVRGTTVLGSIGFFGPPAEHVDPDGSTVAETEVGYGLVAEARGYGFATEALAAMVAAAEAEGVRIRASVEPTNAASLRVLAKAGFTTLRGVDEEGHLVMVRPLASARPSPNRRTAAFEVRATTEEDWERLRDFRLENAREHPISYGATEATTRGFTEDDWRMRARRGDDPATACFVAIDSTTGRWVGMMQGLPSDEHGATPVVTGVYVTKTFRRHGVADALLEPVLDWAAATGAPELRLWVFEGSDPARRFYLRHGFRPTGRTRPLDLDPAQGDLVEMTMLLS